MIDSKQVGVSDRKMSGRTAREASSVACALIVIAVFAYTFSDPFVVTLAGYTCAFALFALSINIILGGVGEVPLGQCLFFGVGAYGAAIGMGKLGLPFQVSVFIALILSVVLAAIIGVITLRLTGAYFSIVSWGLTGVAMVAATNLEEVTGGPLGLFGFPPIEIGPLQLSDPQTYFAVTATILLLAILFLVALRRSPFGAAMDSVRQNRHLARSVGVDVARVRLKAFMLSAPFAALAGALAVPYTQIVTPEVFSVANTVDGLLMVLLGGAQLVVGPVIGAAMFTLIPQAMNLDPNIRILVFSSIIILIMMFAPGGLHQLGVALRDRFGGKTDDDRSR
ncbi:branched-chain amino acid transport system permease protein [Bradyrhizobium yuanmingense]|uniref:Branched-chain amino acid transport system permease protein n=1 Tax=Bradyrhizobium yuanmingense TaxID=108015 RepID=A0A1C3VHZ9_9BRAD|nr:branched-chain amino acid ABC transporter permease [Bradyrhizobium yuanmingense]TWI28422.1 branched-chain amino acid transport system permease protein [Bradyrhizobium yuanmingense]SCB27318.1 branched-chain amino acid transport system permease protein [Bradyrhizobium yuanmingense]